MGQNRSMTIEMRGMPWPVRLFLGYAFVLLAGIGLSLRYVVDLAISVPISPLGILVMCLLAYTIFTITLVLQRKVAARRLAFGLASLTIPTMLWTAFTAPWPVPLFLLALAGLLITGLRRPSVAAWLIEE